jgi:pyroglutamyl-peptidase
MTKKIMQVIFVFLVITTVSYQCLAKIDNLDGGKSDNTVLLTGFEPFYTYTVNPSQLVVENLNGTALSNYSIIGLVLPVNFSTSISNIVEAIDIYNPQLIISLGLNGEARWIQVENIALNLRKRPRSDPLWFLPKKLDRSGPLVLKSTLPTHNIVDEIKSVGIPSRHSIYAGTYVCNSLFYQTLRYIDVEDFQIPMGFVHLPPLDFQEPYGMNITDIQSAVVSALTACLSS